MRKVVKIILPFFLLFFSLNLLSQTNIIQNGQFDDGLNHWQWFRSATGDEILVDTNSRLSGKYCLKVDLAQEKSTNWEQQFGQFVYLDSLAVYEFTFIGKADSLREVDMMFQEDSDADGDGNSYETYSRRITLDTVPKVYGPLTIYYKDRDSIKYKLEFMVGMGDTIEMYFDSIVVNRYFPPKVEITDPLDSAVYQLGEPVTVTANAQDDVGVIGVGFYDKDTNMIGWAASPGPYADVINPLPTGIHNVFAYAFDTDSLNSEPDSVTIIINDAPVAMTANDTVIHVDSFFYIGNVVNTVGTIDSYQWRKLSGPAVTETLSQDTIQLNDMIEDSIYRYELKVTDSYGATGLDTIDITYDELVGVEALTTNTNITIYPNPLNSGLLKISLGEEIANGIISIMNTNGKVVITELIDGKHEITIPYDLFKPGVYIVKVENAGFTEQVKLIVQ